MSLVHRGLFLILFFFSVSTAAWAQKTEWMSGGDAIDMSRRLARDGMIVTDMQCKDSGSTGFGVESASVQLTFEKNVKHTRWVLDGWPNLTVNKKYWEEKGFHLVKSVPFTRKKSGQTVYCTLYYR